MSRRSLLCVPMTSGDLLDTAQPQAGVGSAPWTEPQRPARGCGRRGRPVGGRGVREWVELVPGPLCKTPALPTPQFPSQRSQGCAFPSRGPRDLPQTTPPLGQHALVPASPRSWVIYLPDGDRRPRLELELPSKQPGLISKRSRQLLEPLRLKSASHRRVAAKAPRL